MLLFRCAASLPKSFLVVSSDPPSWQKRFIVISHMVYPHWLGFRRGRWISRSRSISAVGAGSGCGKLPSVIVAFTGFNFYGSEYGAGNLFRRAGGMPARQSVPHLFPHRRFMNQIQQQLPECFRGGRFLFE